MASAEAAIASVLPVEAVVSAAASAAAAMASAAAAMASAAGVAMDSVAEEATAGAIGKSYDSPDSTCRTFSARTVMVNGF